MKKILLFISIFPFFCSCGNKTRYAEGNNDSIKTVSAPAFSADSAYLRIIEQCAFGPRVNNSMAHEACGDYIVKAFELYGLTVVEQRANLKQYDGTTLKARNIIASYKPELKERILVCAHWDSRPWADNDPDEANHRKPVMAANDGASGVAVMLEAARLLSEKAPSVGVDFVCFDAEDCGVPSWDDDGGKNEDTWCLGSQYWSKNPHKENYKARFGILLDMVGGQGARFYQEGYSMRYAQDVVDKIWNAAEAVGYGSMFPKETSGFVTDDHLFVNKDAGIPTVDIIPYYPDNKSSGFGSTWHTVNDTPENIDKNTLSAVGQTLIYVIYSEK